VVYGLLGLKTHCKTLLIVRREGSSLRRYVHIGTGNYNNRTARQYSDLGLLTSRPDIGADVSDLFNILTGLSRQRTFRQLLVAPATLRDSFLRLVERETGHAAAGRPARIELKMNALIDRASVAALYAASSAGVEIDLIVRGACTLVPGVKGVSDRIRVRSIVGEFLEHSRIWRFLNGGSPQWFIGSGDLMERNLDRRIEVFAPVEDRDAQARLDGILETLLADRAPRRQARHGRRPGGVQDGCPLARPGSGGGPSAAARAGCPRAMDMTESPPEAIRSAPDELAREDPQPGPQGPPPAPTPPALPSLGQAPGDIDVDDAFAVAGRKAMWPHVRRLLDVEAALRDPNRPHDLKRYRVATRRLRAALRAFEGAFPRREVRDLRDDLGELATVAGAARDLEVRIADLTQWALERGGEAPAGVRPLSETWQAERADALARLDARFSTRRHRRLLEDLVAFVEAPAGSARRAGETPVRPIGLQAGSLIWDSYERLLAYDRGIRWADLVTMHQLRIEAKRLRYLLEFLGEILGPERSDLIVRLVAVQDHLGLLNDAAVTSAAVRTFLQEGSRPLGPIERAEISTYLHERERETLRLRRGATRPWRAVAGVTFARRLARTLPTTRRQVPPGLPRQRADRVAGASQPG
jgi:CHAD domain-containing protein